MSVTLFAVALAVSSTAYAINRRVRLVSWATVRPSSWTAVVLMAMAPVMAAVPVVAVAQEPWADRDLVSILAGVLVMVCASVCATIYAERRLWRNGPPSCMLRQPGDALRVVTLPINPPEPISMAEAHSVTGRGIED